MTPNESADVPRRRLCGVLSPHQVEDAGRGASRRRDASRRRTIRSRWHTARSASGSATARRGVARTTICRWSPASRAFSDEELAVAGGDDPGRARGLDSARRIQAEARFARRIRADSRAGAASAAVARTSRSGVTSCWTLSPGGDCAGFRSRRRAICSSISRAIRWPPRADANTCSASLAADGVVRVSVGVHRARRASRLRVVHGHRRRGDASASGNARLSLRAVRAVGVQAADGALRDARARARRDAACGPVRRSVRGRAPEHARGHRASTR